MKIAIITPTFPPYTGGIGNVAYYNARQLAKLGHEVVVFTPDYGQGDISDINFKLVKVKPLFKYGNAALVLKLFKLLKGFDIIHLHYPFFGGAEIVWLRKFFCSMFYVSCSMILHYHMDTVGRGWNSWLFKFHSKFCLPRVVKAADKVIVTSLDYAKNSNLNKFLAREPDKFIEIPNGVDTTIFNPQPKDEGLLKKHGLQPNDKLVLFVGGLDKAHYFKGVGYLIQAVKLLAAKLIIVGQGELKSQYQDLAGQLQIENRVIFTGGADNQQLAKYYNLADIVVLPSIDKSEAFGMILIEAMACGKPVVASNLPGVRSVVDNQVGLLAQPEDFNDLANKINYLLENLDKATEMGEKGRERVEERYEWEEIGKEIDRVYRSLNLK